MELSIPVYLKNLLELVIRRDASDLHLCVGLPPIIRVNDELQKLEQKPLDNNEILTMLESLISGRKIDVDSLKEVDLGIELKDLARFRVNIYRDNMGLCAAFRYIPNTIKTLHELGLPECVDQICDMQRGLFIITGIVGSGKTTTLASIIDTINTRKTSHIITIEDPIEFLHKHKKCIVNQREVGTHTPSFLEALRVALREDPDIILVGELRDLETISMAITAAETGHLVLATLHTRGAPQAVDRMIDVFPPHQQEQIRVQLSDVLEMVVSQVLIPSVDRKRRYLACEVMVATPAIKNLIREKKTYQLKNEIEMGTQFGMQTLEKSLRQLIDSGKIAFEAALPWVTDRKFFESYSKVK